MSNIQLSASPVEAIIYQPKHISPKGGIVLLHGSEGGSAKWIDVIAVLLAANGFLTMPKSYNKADALLTRPDIKNVPLEGTENALLYMRKLMNSYNQKIGLLGVSRGAEQALLISQLLSEENSLAMPDALAVHASTSKLKPAFILADYQPSIRQLLKKLNCLVGRKKLPPAWCWRNSHQRTLPNTNIEIEKYPNPVLITHGMEDNLWNIEESRILAKRRQVKKLPTEVHYFAGEGHSLGIDARNLWLDMLSDFFTRHLSNSRQA
jgi:acetyl esterase/lipase